MTKAPSSVRLDELMTLIEQYFREHNEVLRADTVDPDWGGYICAPWDAVKAIFPEDFTMPDALRLLSEIEPQTMCSNFKAEDIELYASVKDVLVELLLRIVETLFDNRVKSDPELTRIYNERNERENAAAAKTVPTLLTPYAVGARSV